MDPLEKAVDRAAVARRVRSAETTILDLHAENERLRAALKKLDNMITQWAKDEGFPRENSACWQVVREALR